MKEGDIIMNGKERRRMVVFSRVKNGGLKLGDAAKILNISYRQAKRIKRRYKEEGDIGLVHRSRGKVSYRRIGEWERSKIMKRVFERYEDFGPTFACEKLWEDGHKLSRETLRRWLIESGKANYHRRKGRKHRKQRQRKAHFGEMIQMDGSHHDWLENGQQICLMNMVDDATGTTYCQLDSGETIEVAMRSLLRWVEQYGVPRAIYCDYKNLFYSKRDPNREEQLAGKKAMTQFGGLCDRLGIELIFASSAQAKGRVERKNAVLQDRLIKEMRLLKIKDMIKANNFIEKYLPQFNKQFFRAPAQAADYHLRPPEGFRNMFYTQAMRTLQNDWTISYHTRIFQITKVNGHLPRPKDKVQVNRMLDGNLHLVHKEHELDFQEIHQRPPKMVPPLLPRKPLKPAANHPWRIANQALFKELRKERKAYPHSQKSPSQIHVGQNLSSFRLRSDPFHNLPGGFSAQVDKLIINFTGINP